MALNRPSTPLDDLPIIGSDAPDPPVRGLFLRLNSSQFRREMNRIVCGVPRLIFSLQGTCAARRIRSIGLNRGERRWLWGLNQIVMPSAAGSARTGEQNDELMRSRTEGIGDLLHR